MMKRLALYQPFIGSAWQLFAMLAAGVITAGVISFGITLNQALAIAFSAITLTIWAHNRLSGLISAMMFFMSKSLWVRAAFAIEGSAAGSRFDLLGITPALLLAGLIIWQMFQDFLSGRRLFSDRSRQLMIACAAISLITIIYCGSPLVGLGGFERNVLPNMLILFLASSVVTGHGDAVKLIKAMLVFGLISIAYAIGQYMIGLYPWEISWFKSIAEETGLSGWLTIGLRGIEFRIFSVFYGYMDFFFTNTLIFALAVAYRDIWDSGWRRVYRLFVICWFIILALSLERMPLIMTLVSILAIKYLKATTGGRRKIAFISLTMAGGLYGVLLLGGPTLKSTGAGKLIRLAELANPFQATSMLDRTETKWLPAIETIKGNPLGVGIGYGSQTKARESAMESDNYVQPHNELIQKTLETGIIGGIIYLLLLIAIFKDNLALIRHKKFSMMGAGMAAATIAFWLCGMVNLPFSGSSGILYWLMAGAALSLNDRMFQSETSPKQVSEPADRVKECLVQDET